MTMNQNRQGEELKDDRNNAAGAQQEDSRQLGDSLSGSIQSEQGQQNQQSQQGGNMQGGSQVGGREGGEESSQEGAEQTLGLDSQQSGQQGSQQSGTQGSMQRAGDQDMALDPQEKPAEQLTPEELRLMADTMPGEGPGDD